MPTLTTTIEDPCPLLAYSSTGWSQGSSGTDNLASSYSQSSFTASKVADSSVSFTFNGTGVQIFGARRGNHGNFQITIDNSTFPSISGTGDNRFQDTLFSTTSLSQGLHTVTLTNQPTDGNHNFVDIDFITWQSKIGKDGDQLVVKTVQDTDSSFVYDPPAAWSNNPDKLGLFSGGSGRSITTSSGGTLTYTFEGDGVQLFGPIGPNGAPYSIQIDGGLVRRFSSAKSFFTPQMMLFHADNLGDGKHVLKLEYQPTSLNQTFAIDYANVLSSSSMSTAQLSQASSSTKLSGGLIAGIVIPTLVIVGCLVALIFILLRRRRAQPTRGKVEEGFSFNGEVLAPPSGPPYTPSTSDNMAYASGTVQPARLARGNSSATRSTFTFTTFNPSTMGHQSTTGRSYHTRSELPPSPTETHFTQSDPYATAASSSLAGHNSTNPRPTQNAKGQTVLLPSTVGQGLSDVPEDELRATRREVEGRAQDFGSLSSPGPELAPPDYHQATEPYRPSTPRAGDS